MLFLSPPMTFTRPKPVGYKLSALIIKKKRTEFLVIHHFKNSRNADFSHKRICDFIVVCSLYYSFYLLYVSKSRPLLTTNSTTWSYYLMKTEAVIVVR